MPPPAFDVKRHDPFNDVETPGTGNAADAFWAVNGGSPVLTDPEAAILVVAVLENDDGGAEAKRGIVKGVIGSSVLSTLSSDRANRVSRHVDDISSAAGTPRAPNFDDKVGAPQEPRFTADQLAQAKRGEAARQTIAAGPLGRLTSDGTPKFDGRGRSRDFAGVVLSWHPDPGAHAVRGPIGARWNAIGRERFGYPVTDERRTADGRGRFTPFRALHLANRPEASIHWSPGTGAREIFGAIRDKWLQIGAEGGLGYPVGPEGNAPGGRRQPFQRGAIVWSPSGGAVAR